MAATEARDADGNVDADRFRDLVAASLVKATDWDLGLGDLGPAVWELGAEDARTPDQQRRLDRLSTYPEPSEAVELLRELEGLGPQTLFELIQYAVHARERLSVGLDPVRDGDTGAVLTGRLVGPPASSSGSTARCRRQASSRPTALATR